jgi:hypothetical protein
VLLFLIDGTPDMPTMKSRRLTTLLLALTCSMSVATAARAGNYNEAINGDLSGVPASPTAWLLGEGANVLTGAGGPDDMDVNDYDLVAFTVPGGMQLNSIIITSFGIDGRQNFFGVQEGSPWLDELGMDVVGTYLTGYELVEVSEIGSDLLQKMVDVNNPNSLQPPLGSGVYTLLAQDTSSPFSYTLTFNVSNVPEPTGALVGGVAALAFAGVARRRRGG